MGVYTEFVDGYAVESTYGTSIITGAGDTTYLFGLIGHETAYYPSPSFDMVRGATALSSQEYAQAQLGKGRAQLMGMLPVGIQNGVLLWAVMGKSSTTGSDPYTHTITVPSAVDGVLPLLPSFTLQHERKGTATDWALQYTGCKVAGLRLVTTWDTPYLVGRVDWIAQEASDPGFVLTNAPALPATASTGPYHFNNLTRTFDGNAVDGLVGLELAILPGLKPIYTHRWSGSTYKGHYPESLVEATAKEYELRLAYHPGSDDLWDELVTTTDNTKDIVLKWTRSTNDYIQITCTDCWVVDHETVSPGWDDKFTEQVTIHPRSLSIEVKDSIAANAGGAYVE